MSGNEKIVKLSASYKGYIWGGRRLIDDFGMDCGLDRLAEAWLVSAHPEGQSSVISGKDSGMIFGDYIERYYHEITEKALRYRFIPTMSTALQMTASAASLRCGSSWTVLPVPASMLALRKT